MLVATRCKSEAPSIRAAQEAIGKTVELHLNLPVSFNCMSSIEDTEVCSGDTESDEIMTQVGDATGSP